jgi:hypothetical protein
MTEMSPRLAPSSGTLILVDSESRTINGNSGAIKGMGAVTALRAQLHVTEASGLGVDEEGNPTEFPGSILTVLVEETLDDRNWKQIGEFREKSGVGSETISLGGPLAETIRVSWTITGYSPLFRFSVTSPACWSPPTVSVVRPPDGATQVAFKPPELAESWPLVRAVFSEDMEPATLTTSTFTLVKDGSATLVDAKVSYDPEFQMAILEPSVDLEAGTKYTATVKGGAVGCTSCAKDKTGSPLVPDKVWSFTTSEG